MHLGTSVTPASLASDLKIELLVRGDRPDAATIAYARKKILAAARATPVPVRLGRVKLTFEAHRTIQHPARVEVMLDLDGRTLRVQGTARSAREAVDIVEERLRRRLVDVRGRGTTLRRRKPRPTGRGRQR